jgi:predicted double-glycine peptidase
MLVVRGIFAVLGSLALILLVTLSARAGDLPVSVGGGSFSLPVTSAKEAKFTTMIKQRYDFSCGAAAVATLLSFHYDRPTTEQEAFLAMYEAGDKNQIKTAGFSLFDMKGYLQSKGLRADGFKISLDKLAEARIPAITIIETNGFRHFVTIKGIKDGEVLVGDPALGTKIYRRAAFEAVWQKIVFVIRDEVELAQSNFNDERDWRIRQKAPFGTALTRDSIATFTLMLPAGNEF